MLHSKIIIDELGILDALVNTKSAVLMLNSAVLDSLTSYPAF